MFKDFHVTYLHLTLCLFQCAGCDSSSKVGILIIWLLIEAYIWRDGNSQHGEQTGQFMMSHLQQTSVIVVHMCHHWVIFTTFIMFFINIAIVQPVWTAVASRGSGVANGGGSPPSSGHWQLEWHDWGMSHDSRGHDWRNGTVHWNIVRSSKLIKIVIIVVGFLKCTYLFCGNLKTPYIKWSQSVHCKDPP